MESGLETLAGGIEISLIWLGETQGVWQNEE